MERLKLATVGFVYAAGMFLVCSALLFVYWLVLKNPESRLLGIFLILPIHPIGMAFWFALMAVLAIPFVGPYLLVRLLLGKHETATRCKFW